MKKVTFNVEADTVIQLGESLYKNIYGILVEYITNSYDADASLVKISIDRDKRYVLIDDNGIGMSHEELETIFMHVGSNRRKKSNQTAKGRLVTGRKGFGKLACFGLFENFELETIKDNFKSTLIIETNEDEYGEFTYSAKINDKPVSTEKNDGTVIRLKNNTQNIPNNDSLAESIAKRINLMYDYSPDDKNGFNIQLEDIVVNKKYRDDFIVNLGNKFKYKIPEDLQRFTEEESIIEYISNNNIHGIIIAKEKTVRIKESKGVVLFARGKLCQEATYLNINPSNNYGYAHLYSEFYVDFIDNESKDNIGTDRTALKDTETTKKLFEVIEVLMKSYARLYDEDEKQIKKNKISVLKDNDEYKKIIKTIDTILDNKFKIELNKILDMKIEKNIDKKNNNLNFENFAKLASSIVPTHSIQSVQINKDDPKDNITTSYDFLMNYLRNKYKYRGNDGIDMINNIFGKTSKHKEFSKLTECLVLQIKNDLSSSLRDLGSSIVNLRNSIVHTNNRTCIKNSISIENSKRFLIMIDLFIELDNMFFKFKEKE